MERTPRRREARVRKVEVRLTPSEHEMYAELAADLGMDISEMVRQAVREFRDRQRREQEPS